MFKKGDRVRSTAHYASQFPLHIKKNGGRPLHGRVRRIAQDGCVVVKWVQYQSEMTLDQNFLTIDRTEEKQEPTVTLTPELYEQLHGRGAEVWAKTYNRVAGVKLSGAQEDDLAAWFANAMQAATDRALRNETKSR